MNLVGTWGHLLEKSSLASREERSKEVFYHKKEREGAKIFSVIEKAMHIGEPLNSEK